LIEKGRVGEPVRGQLSLAMDKVLQEIDMVGDDIGFGIGPVERWSGRSGRRCPATLRVPELV